MWFSVGGVLTTRQAIDGLDSQHHRNPGVVAYTCDQSSGWKIRDSRSSWVYNKFKTSLGYLRPCLRNKKKVVKMTFIVCI